ncbi:MAG: hypothetical protein LBQ98_04965 [Nitrososphaerota archaeon]|jgi:hypothetical protein|nr:hypothetical protein [Nitrososphaerota archaeon]
MMNQNQKRIISIFVVFALVAGCLATIAPASAELKSVPESEIDLMVRDLEANSALTRIDGIPESINEHTFATLWYGDKDGVSVVYLLIKLTTSGKPADGATLDNTPADVIYYYVPDQGNGNSFSLIKFSNVDVQADSWISVSIANSNHAFSIDASVGDIFPLKSGSLGVSATLVEQFYNEYHKPVTKMFESKDTLVSWVGYGVNAATLPNGFNGGFFDNGMTYLAINVADLVALGDAGADIGIALSNMPGKSISEKWNTPVDHTYNLKIVDAQLIVTCDLIAGNFGTLLSTTGWSLNYNPTKDIKHDNKATYVLPENVGTIYVFFHIEKGAKWLKVIDCEWDYDGEIYTEDFTGSFTVNVLDSNGNVVVTTDEFGLINDLAEGAYCVQIIVDDVVIAGKSANVVANDTADVAFGEVIVNTAPQRIVVCSVCNQ